MFKVYLRAENLLRLLDGPFASQSRELQSRETRIIKEYIKVHHSKYGEIVQCRTDIANHGYRYMNRISANKSKIIIIIMIMIMKMTLLSSILKLMV